MGVFLCRAMGPGEGAQNHTDTPITRPGRAVTTACTRKLGAVQLNAFLHKTLLRFKNFGLPSIPPTSAFIFFCRVSPSWARIRSTNPSARPAFCWWNFSCPFNTCLRLLISFAAFPNTILLVSRKLAERG